MVRQAHHEGVVKVERDAARRSCERGAVEVNHRPAHPHQRAGVGQVLQPRDRRLRAQIALRGRRVERHLEHGIAAQCVGVDGVLITGGDHQQPESDDVGEAVRDLLRLARIDETIRKPSATPSRLSTSRNASTPPFDDSNPPSNLTSTRLPPTGDRPGSGSVASFMAGAARLKSDESV